MSLKPVSRPTVLSPPPPGAARRPSPPQPARARAAPSVAGLAAVTDDQLVALASTPQGEAALTTIAQALKSQGSLDAGQQRLVDRIELATWRPSGGLQVAPPALERDFNTRLRRAMLQSPSLRQIVRDVEADTAHPVKVSLVRGDPTRLDSFATQKLDLKDLDVLPTSPRPDFPEGTTQGAVLTHLLSEQHLKALGYDKDTSHVYAIRAENAYRNDLGQKTRRIDAVGKDESHVELPGGGRAIITNFDDGHSEVLKFDPNGELLGTHWAPTLPLPPPVIPFLLF